MEKASTRDMETGTQRHFTSAQLYSLLVEGERTPERTRIFHHLQKCSLCRYEMKELIKAHEEAESFDIALPKAADTGPGGEIKATTAAGKYKVEILPSLDKKGEGVATLRVTRGGENCEGRNIVLRDKNARILLKGPIVEGEISRRIDRIDEIEKPFTVWDR